MGGERIVKIGVGNWLLWRYVFASEKYEYHAK